MNAYFFKMTKEEKENILDQHKHLYDGYVTEYIKPKQEQLYVQDFANDKNGITVNNKGEVSTYKNVNINEDVFSGSHGFEPEPTFESEEDESYMVSLGEKLDMIGDGPDDLVNGTVDIDDAENETMFLIDPEMNDDIMGYEDEEEWESDVFGDDFEDDEKGKIAFNIKECLDMFNRFKNF